MLLNKDIKILQEPYFVLIRQTDNFMEIKSVNTSHCWVIQKIDNSSRLPVVIYHKHRQSDPYYHRHKKAATVAQAVVEIKSHDAYISRL